MSKAKYILPMFPYPSGNLHMGHLRVYCISDCIARFNKLHGRQPVLHPFGWDAFGLPAENAAFDNSSHPATWTAQNILSMRHQLALMDLDVDWSREISTCDPSYYKFSQKLFVDLYNDGLVERKYSTVNWDPVDGTVLANEQVDVNGRAERSGALVVKKELLQWFFKITKFAQELLDDLKILDWPHSIKQQQRNWIGRSAGMEVEFPLSNDSSHSIKVFTTRPETIYGVKFIAISPTHPILKIPGAHEQPLPITSHHEDLHGKSISGYDTKLRAMHPLTAEIIPIYVANYVVGTYATGAVMGVPSTHPMDSEFAEKLMQTRSHTTIIEGDILINVPIPMCGMSTKDARSWIFKEASKLGFGRKKVVYRLHDWLVSRQRYWGTPIPIIHCPGCGIVPVPEHQLPVLLPDVERFERGVDSPLKLLEHWRNCKCPRCGKSASRETDTMDTFVDSSWYYLRFCDPKNPDAYASPEKVQLPVDLYIGGIEHAILHLLYARFISKYLNSKGVYQIPNGEPFTKLLAQGMVKGRTFKCPGTGRYFKPQDVDLSVNPRSKCGIPLTLSYEKMSKSKHNGVNPVDVIKEYGSDATRMYILNKAPPTDDLVWDDKGVIGMTRVLGRISGMVDHTIDRQKARPTGKRGSRKMVDLTNTTIRKVTTTLTETYHLNTAVSDIIKLINEIPFADPASETGTLKAVIQLLAPFAPAACEELWTRLVGGSIWDAGWPVPYVCDEYAETRIVHININGKGRGSLDINAGIIHDSEAVLEALRHSEIWEKWASNQKVGRVIYKERKDGSEWILSVILL